MTNRTNQWRIAFNLQAQINPILSRHEDSFLQILGNAEEEHFFEPEYMDPYIFNSLENLVGSSAPNIARTYESIAKITA